jgi:hypothetical protein
MSALQTEVERLHRFFQEWFNGELDDTDAVFAAFESALAEGFHIITPDGQVLSRAEILAMVRGFRGGWQNSRIWIKECKLRAELGPVALVTYEEWQDVAGEVKGRLSSALFDLGDGRDDSLRWLHVHETWLPEG